MTRSLFIAAIIICLTLGLYLAWAAQRARYFGDINPALPPPYPDGALVLVERWLDQQIPANGYLKVHGEWPMVQMCALGASAVMFGTGVVVTFAAFPSLRRATRRATRRAIRSVMSTPA